MEARALPETHVQTISASWCRDVDDARAMMRVAADAGASALLCVTGDGVRGKKSHLDALALLRAARALRDAGEIDSDVRLACAANPCLEASRLRTPRVSPSSLLAAKIEAGADAVITQPSVVPSLARAWRREIQASGLARDVTHIAGIAVPTSARSAERWHRLVFGVRCSDEWLRSREETRRSIREEADAWRAMEEHVSNLEQHDLGLAFRKRWIEERAELFAAEAVTSADFPARGAHVMPVTPAGYRSAAAVADKILKLLA
jgi:5,10-methylenetetrahydrofolate reductase